MGRESVPGRCPVRSLSLIPPVVLGARSNVGSFDPKGGSLERAHLDRQGVATRGLPRGELRRRVRDRGAVSAVAMPPAVCGGRLAARGDGEKLVSPHTKGLCSGEIVRRMRPGGEGACVTTLLEMRFGAQR